jgi:hypothetical protein
MELQTLGDIFEGIATQTGGTGLFKVDTVWGSWSAASLQLLRSSYEPRDVARIVMAVQWHDGNARLTIDLEARARRDTAVGFEDTSWLVVEGPENITRRLWLDVMEILNRRSSRVGAIVSTSNAQILGLLLVMAGGVALPLLTLQRAHVDTSTSVLITFAVAIALTLPYILWVMPAASPRVQVTGWGRLSITRRRAATWGVAIGAGLIVWAIGFLVQYSLSA